jgi:hypothetical protein
MEKAKIFYFSVFVFVVVAFIFHVNAMGHHHWKKATSRYYNRTDFNYTTIGLFTRCVPSEIDNSETCYPNIYPRNSSCTYTACEPRFPNPNCQCDFSSSTKGIAACAIIAAIFLGLVIIILFIHSIKTTASRSFELFLGLFPLILLLLALIFILITLILVGSYLSRDIMYILRTPASTYTLGNYTKKNPIDDIYCSYEIHFQRFFFRHFRNRLDRPSTRR